jgi:hypothetical protein
MNPIQKLKDWVSDGTKDPRAVELPADLRGIVVWEDLGKLP